MNNHDTETLRSSKDYWFACVDVDVLRDKGFSPMAKFIFAVLCTFAGFDSRGCWPSNDAVAEAAGVSTSTVKRAYKELESRGVIARSGRINTDGGQSSSYTRIVGHNAPCYEEGGSQVNPPSTDEPTPYSPVNHITKPMNDIKDSPTGEGELPGYEDLPIAFPEPEQESTASRKDTIRLEEVPKAMKPTAEYFLLKTGRKILTEDEISALHELCANQYPARVQGEIDTACERFRRKGKSLETLTFVYIAGALRNQPSLKKKRKPAKPKPAEVPKRTREEIEADMARIKELEAEFDEDD